MPKQLKMHSYFKVILRSLFFFLTILSLSACQFDLLNPKGRVAADEKQILLLSVVLMLFVVVPVIFLTLAFAWRYRAGNHNAKYHPHWRHSTLLEIIWWSIPCLIIAILGTITWISSHRLDPYRPLARDKQKTLTIQVIALEWKWLFIYPEQNVATVNFLQVPVNVPLHFQITSEGPMNSLQVPQLGGQIYAMAGMKTQLNLIAEAPGAYRGLSTNFSGNGFSDMQFTLRATSKKEFEKWVKTVKGARMKLTFGRYKELSQASVLPGIRYYSAANKMLFETVVMKAMMPMPTSPKGA